MKVSIFARAAWLQSGNGTAPVISGSADSFCSPDRSLIVVAEIDPPVRERDGRSPAALLADLYAKFGTKAFAEIRGAFRCVIWDGRRGELIAATDPVGLLPVYYRPATGGITVSSSLRTLAADSFPWSNNECRTLDVGARGNIAPRGHALPPVRRRSDALDDLRGDPAPSSGVFSFRPAGAHHAPGVLGPLLPGGPVRPAARSREEAEG